MNGAFVHLRWMNAPFVEEVPGYGSGAAPRFAR